MEEGGRRKGELVEEWEVTLTRERGKARRDFGKVRSLKGLGRRKSRTE